jgi:hypothetical protein
MNEKANTPVPLSPEEAYLASKLLGKSLFSAIQLNKEMDRAKALQQQESNDILRIPIPVQKLGEEKTYGYDYDPIKDILQRFDLGHLANPPEVETDENILSGFRHRHFKSKHPIKHLLGKNPHKKYTEKKGEIEGEPPGIIGRALRFNRNPIRTFVGGEAGFSEARKEYYELEKRKIQEDLRKAQEEYLGVLQRVKQGEETPMIDAFCNGMATELTIPELSKSAATAEDVEIGDGSIKRLLRSALGVAAKPAQPALDLGATGLLGAAGGTGYLTYILKKKMRERDNDRYMESTLPTRVELEPFQLK